jgi:integrase
MSEDSKPEDFVFPALKGEGHAIGIRRAFHRACKAAKLDPVPRIHDLRHSFASFAIADGASLFLVSKLLGHAASAVTERYAHLSNDPLADAAAVVGARLMPTASSAADQSEENAEIIPLRR